MKVKINITHQRDHYDDYFPEDIKFTCPNCNHVNNSETINYEDYVSDGCMLFCIECRYRYKLSREEEFPKNIIIDNLLENNIYYKHSITKYNEIYDIFEYEINCDKFYKIVNNDLDYYYADNVLEQDKIIEFIKSGFNRTIGEKYNIKSRLKNKYWYHEHINNKINNELDDDLDEKKFNIGIIIDNYYINENEIFELLDISNDGTYVYTQCIDNNNKIYDFTYWGD